MDKASFLRPSDLKRHQRLVHDEHKQEAYSYFEHEVYPNASLAGFKKKAIRMLINGKHCLARPDTGSDRNIMSEAQALELGVSIQTEPQHHDIFQIGTGKIIQSIGKALVPFELLDSSSNSGESSWFHILKKCPSPLIMGLNFIKKIQLYKNKHLLVDYVSSIVLPTFKWIGAPQQRISFTADSRAITGCADTGADLDFMSLKCAIDNCFFIDTADEARRSVMLADESIVSTVGQVHVKSMYLSQFADFEMTFYVLDGLPCDVIFGEEFLEGIDAFNTCDIMNSEGSSYVFALNTLINLGPIQAFLSRSKNTSLEGNVQLQKHDKAMEAETYRRNKVDRVILKIKDQTREQAARQEEDRKRKMFDDLHARCSSCIKGLQQNRLPRLQIQKPLESNCSRGPNLRTNSVRNDDLGFLTDHHLLEENPWE